MRTITIDNVMSFAEIVGDHSPIHIDDDYAKTTTFGGPIVHGALLVGFLSAAVSKLPGTIIYISQNLYFLKPARVGDTIEAKAEVLSDLDGHGGFWLKIECKNQDGHILVIGGARVKVI